MALLLLVPGRWQVEHVARDAALPNMFGRSSLTKAGCSATQRSVAPSGRPTGALVRWFEGTVEVKRPPSRPEVPRVEEITWLSTAQACGLLGVSARTLYGFIDSGQLVGYRFGRVIRIQATDVHAFIEQARIQPGGLRFATDAIDGVLRDLGSTAA